MRPSVAADRDLVAVDDAGDADAGLVAEALDRRQRPDLCARGAGDRLRDRVLGGALDGAGEAQDVGARRAVQQGDLGELHLALGDGAGLVEHDRVDAPRLLEDLRAP